MSYSSPRVLGSAITAMIVWSGCASEGSLTTPERNLQCVDVSGQGETRGDIHRLKGSGTFAFGGEERHVQVGLYLFDMTPISGGGIRVDAQYQFNLGNGDSFLTRDDVTFDPALTPDTYHFSVAMTIFDASGMFAHLIDKRPVALSAEISFGPPRTQGEAMTAFEEFQVSGEICGLQ